MRDFAICCVGGGSSLKILLITPLYPGYLNQSKLMPHTQCTISQGNGQKSSG